MGCWKCWRQRRMRVTTGWKGNLVNRKPGKYCNYKNMRRKKNNRRPWQCWIKKTVEHLEDADAKDKWGNRREIWSVEHLPTTLLNLCSVFYSWVFIFALLLNICVTFILPLFVFHHRKNIIFMKMYFLAFYSSKSVHYFKADLNTYFNKSPTSPPPQAGVVALQRPGLKLFYLSFLKWCQVFFFFRILCGRMSILIQLLEELKVIFLTETKCKIRFIYVGFNCKRKEVG